jgi:hypothetical protein
MAAQGLVLACSSTPSALAGSMSGGSVHGYIRVKLKNLGTGTAYLGDSGVTTAGYPLSTGDAPLEVNLLTGESLWMASSSGATPSVGVLRLNETT